MTHFDYDVIICGGGPGGSTCALAFANTNIKIAVLEKNSFPRKKVCGDGLAAYVPKVLNKISPVYAEEFYKFSKKIPIPKFVAYSCNDKKLEGNFPENWYCSPRYDFDFFLYQLASNLPNVTYLFDHQLQNIEIETEGVSVTTTNNKIITSKIIIGCDGASSILRRKLTNYQMEPTYNFATVRAYFSGVSNVNKEAYEIYLSKKYPYGYLWVFPSENGLVNVGVIILSSTVIGRKLNLKEVLFEVIEETPRLKNKFEKATHIGDVEGGSIPFAFSRYPISGTRFMLCGDAASLADPVTGEGIGPAMVSGRIAAFHAIDCFKKDDFSAPSMKGYELKIEKKFGRLMRRRKLLADKLFQHPRVVDKLFYLLNIPKFFKTLIKFAS